MRLTASLLLALLTSITYASEPIWLDVRTPQEFSEEHVQNAINIPFDQITTGITGISADKGSEIVLYCRSGRRADIAMSTLQQLGYTNVVNLKTLEAAKAARALRTSESKKNTVENENEN